MMSHRLNVAHLGRNGTSARRRALEAVAAVAGLAGGMILAEPVIAAATSLWSGFVLPAYDELIKNGLLAWCM